MLQMKFRQSANGLRTDQRDIARKDQNVRIGRQRLRRAHQRVAGAALLGLQHKVHAAMGNGLPDALGFVADDGENPICRHNLPGRLYHVQ